MYHAGGGSGRAGWIAEGTDGNLYLVPDEPGGWLRRADYEGCSDQLAPVAPTRARMLMWFVYGDIGPVTIAHGEGDPSR
jgi:hypothetical protein